MILIKAEKLNIEKYMGKWFEIAKKPFFFQRNCKNAIAYYSLNKENMTISILNTCKTRSGRIKKAKGIGYFTKKPNVLLISFSMFAPKSAYIIEFVDQKYQYAIVGSVNKKYLWFLARKAHINQTIFENLVSIAKYKRYDLSDLQISRRIVK